MASAPNSLGLLAGTEGAFRFSVSAIEAARIGATRDRKAGKSWMPKSWAPSLASVGGRHAIDPELKFGLSVSGAPLKLSAVPKASSGG
jgi:hypothetical protein